MSSFGIHKGFAEPVIVRAPPRGRAVVRWSVLVALALAPFAIGCRYAWAYAPLLVVCFAAGAYSYRHERKLVQQGTPVASLPGGLALLALMAMVAFQLIPLPPLVLSIVSPGSYAFYNDALLLPLRAWKPITASPADTLRGLLFLGGMSLCYRAAYNELDDPGWRRKLVLGIVAAGFLLTLEALVQQAYSPRVIYGFYRPPVDWAVFGPYMNRNHFAGYMLMSASLGIGLCAESLTRLRRAWDRRRKRKWLALGDAEGSAFLRYTAVAMVLVTGLLATGSRGGLLGLAAALLAGAFASRHRRTTIVVMVLIVALGVGWIGVKAYTSGFSTRGIWRSRVAMWVDCLGMVRLYPVFGAGFNAFGTSYPMHQHVWRTDWYVATHNEYLQVITDLGLAGAIPAVILLVTLLRRGRRSASRGPLELAVFAAVTALLGQNVVDFNWQIPANAVTFAALAGLAAQDDPAPKHRTRERRA
jgi:putative inorganic carbon (HCO3(-)) transporter